MTITGALQKRRTDLDRRDHADEQRAYDPADSFAGTSAFSVAIRYNSPPGEARLYPGANRD
jgi:hypothetical protein